MILWMAKNEILDFRKISDVFRPKSMFLKEHVYNIFPGHAVPICFRANIFRAVPCQDFSVPRFSVPGRAMNLRVLRAVPCRGVPVQDSKLNGF